MPRLSKKFAVLLVLAMMASMFVGMGTVSAATTNSVVGAIPLIVGPAPVANQALASLQINETTLGNYANGNVVLFTLPDGVIWDAATYPIAALADTPKDAGGTADNTMALTIVSPSVLQGVITVAGTTTNASVFTIPLVVDINTLGSGALNVNVTAPGTAIQEGNFAVGQFVSGSASATALNTVSSGQVVQTYGTIRIIENSANALAATQTITLRLPAGFTWNAAPAATIIQPAGGTFAFTVASPVWADQLATFTVLTGSTTPAVIDITTPIRRGSNVTPQDITVEVGGTANIGASLVVGNYADYGITVTAESPTAIKAGAADQKIAKVTIQENIPGSIIGGRSLTLALPDNCLFETVPGATITGGNLPAITAALGSFDTNNAIAVGGVTKGSSITYQLAAGNSTNKSTVVFQNVLIKTAGNASGDIKLTVGGTGSASGEVVVATVNPVVTVTAPEPTQIQPGLTAQSVSDIILTEGVKGSITTEGLASPVINLVCWDGYEFTGVPTITVEEGNVALGTAYKGTSRNIGDTIIIPVKSMSSVASKIKISNVKLDAASYVSTGPAKMSVNGNALGINAWFPNVTALAAPVVANVSNTSATGAAGTSVFTVGSTTFKVNGVEKTAEVAPYIKDGRTYLPIAYVAGCLGIPSGNIIWDAANQTVTLIKGDKVVQMKIGSTTLLVNGAAVTLDAVPEISNSRTCLPVALVAQAFGASVTWDPAAQTVTIK